MNKLSDFKLNTQVIYRYEDGRIDLGAVQGYYGENIRIQWSQEDENDLMDYHYSNPQIVLVSSLMIKQSDISNGAVVKSRNSDDTIEDKLKDLIIHLVGVNQKELACCTIDILQKYTHNTKALEFIERNT